MYIFCADVYCDKCGEDIKARLLKETGKSEEDYADERTYDSDEFPKGPYPDDAESDTPEHCGSHEHCLDPTMIGDFVAGHFFENDLTTDGVEYVKQALADGGEVAEFWAEHYRSAGYDIPDPNDREQILAGMNASQLRDCLMEVLEAADHPASIEDVRAALKGWDLETNNS